MSSLNALGKWRMTTYAVKRICKLPVTGSCAGSHFVQLIYCTYVDRIRPIGRINLPEVAGIWYRRICPWNAKLSTLLFPGDRWYCNYADAKVSRYQKSVDCHTAYDPDEVYSTQLTCLDVFSIDIKRVSKELSMRIVYCINRKWSQPFDSQIKSLCIREK